MTQMISAIKTTSKGSGCINDEVLNILTSTPHHAPVKADHFSQSLPLLHVHGNRRPSPCEATAGGGGGRDGPAPNSRPLSVPVPQLFLLPRPSLHPVAPIHPISALSTAARPPHRSHLAQSAAPQSPCPVSALSTAATANFTRGELATALRKVTDPT